MTTLVTLAMVLPVLVLQHWYSARLDRALPKRWRRLPVLGFNGYRSAASRRTALFESVCFTLLICGMLVGLAIWIDLQDRPFAAGKTIISNAYGLALACFYYGLRIFLIKRWIRTGKPRIDGLRHPEDRSA